MTRPHQRISHVAKYSGIPVFRPSQAWTKTNKVFVCCIRLIWPLEKPLPPKTKTLLVKQREVSSDYGSAIPPDRGPLEDPARVPGMCYPGIRTRAHTEDGFVERIFADTGRSWGRMLKWENGKQKF